MTRSWGIKLGSGGRCVHFCERNNVVGLGWKDIDTSVLASGTWEQVLANVKSEGFDGRAASQIWRFARECEDGDYVLYYDPPRKVVVITRVTSEIRRRTAELEDPADIWLVRSVEYPIGPIPIVDFYGAIKGSLLGPRMSFWALPHPEAIEQIVQGREPGIASAPDPEIRETLARLHELVLHRAEALNEKDWELVAADYFQAQGAIVDGKIGGNRTLVDVEARFDHGELPPEVWRVQVKRYQDRAVGWPEIESYRDRVGDARFCFVSVYGFTPDAATRAEEADILLMDARQFVPFLLSGRARPEVRSKLRLPSSSLP